MNIRRLVLVLALVCALASFAHTALGQLTPRLDHYQFLPRLSVLHESVGDESDFYHVRGTFDFSITPSPLAVFPPIHLAHFLNVDAAGIHRHKDVVVDLDEALNLSGLTGWQRRVPGPIDVFRFRGETANESSVELWTVLLGPWLYLKGATTAPESDPNVPEYHIGALARQRPLADFNDDGVVDGEDLRTWRDDPAGSGGDFLAWQRQLGESPPSLEFLDATLAAAPSSAAASTAAIPEPASLALSAAAVAAAALARRR